MITTITINPVLSSADATARRSDLAEFLRVRRLALQPTDVGLAPGLRRRTAGLRREEVALLAGVSVSWYTWLEQGRPINPSAEVLDALARTLRLDPAEREHLHLLAGRPLARLAPPIEPEPLGEELTALLVALAPSPAYLLGPRWEILAWNEPQLRLLPGLARLAPRDRNLAWIVFADPELRHLLGRWDDEARRVLGQFRADTAAIRDDPGVVALVNRLEQASPEFRDWWPRHDVARFESHVHTFHHPIAGHLRFHQEQLIPAARPDLRLVIQLPVFGDDSTQRLAHATHAVI